MDSLKSDVKGELSTLKTDVEIRTEHTETKLQDSVKDVRKECYGGN